MPNSTAKLFTPYTLKNLTMANRVVMAPMTRNRSPNGVPGADVAAYYRRRAENGVGLIVTEGTTINHRQAQNVPACPHIYGEEALTGWERVVEAVHGARGKIFCQLWHVGAVSQLGIVPKLPIAPISPSGLLKPDTQVGEPISAADIDTVIDAFAEGAANAQKVGFDGIELHGAHGYLIDQFFWRGTNVRRDDYGGDLVARTRFAVEVIERCRARVGPSDPLLLRFSQWKGQDYTARLAETPEELSRFLAPLSHAGVDGLDCSTRRFWEPEFEGSDLNLAGWTKKITGKPTITVGSVSLHIDFLASFGGVDDAKSREGNGAGRSADMGRLVEMLDRGDFDLVAVGRASLADPAWAAKVQKGRYGELKPFSLDALKELV
jgi:2,4-dienoyl-CoA reductase-like NADH-dependent reductase (Old Yellow Enzyme family)